MYDHTTTEPIAESFGFADHPEMLPLRFTDSVVDDAVVVWQHRQEHDIRRTWQLGEADAGGEDGREIELNGGSRSITIRLPPETLQAGHWVVWAAVELRGRAFLWPSEPRRVHIVEED